MKTVLFVCEHGSAKSVVAAAHFNRLAAQRGLDFQAVSCGTDPDEVNHPAAVEGLHADRLEPQATPHLLSAGDLQSAARVISFSDLPDRYSVATSIQVWTVPAVSEDYATSRDAILDRVARLIEDLGCGGAPG